MVAVFRWQEGGKERKVKLVRWLPRFERQDDAIQLDISKAVVRDNLHRAAVSLHFGRFCRSRVCSQSADVIFDGGAARIQMPHRRDYNHEAGVALDGSRLVADA